jgi:hypothetical protein
MGSGWNWLMIMSWQALVLMVLNIWFELFSNFINHLIQHLRFYRLKTIYFVSSCEISGSLVLKH